MVSPQGSAAKSEDPFLILGAIFEEKRVSLTICKVNKFKKVFTKDGEIT